MTKISALPPLNSSDNDDEIPIVDNSTGVTKKIKAQNIVPDGTITPAKIAVGTIVREESTTDRSITGTLGSLSETIDITPGTWEVYCKATLLIEAASNLIQGSRIGLSTSTSSYSHSTLRAIHANHVESYAGTGGLTKTSIITVTFSDIVTVSSNTTFTLIGSRVGTVNATLNASNSSTVLRARKLSDETS